MSTAGFGLIALIPLIVGSPPQENKTLSALLCSGDQTIQIEIPISDEEPGPVSPCHGKGCHAGSCRKGAPASRLTK